MPVIGHLIKQLPGGIAHPQGLFGIYLVTLLQGAHGARPHIAFADAAEHAVDQPFTQGAARQGHLTDRKSFKDGNQDRQTAREDQCAVEGQAIDFQLFQLIALDCLFAQLIQLGQGNVFIHPLCLHDLLQRLHGAGGADTNLPARSAVLFGNRR